jgi:hypothetical protein
VFRWHTAPTLLSVQILPGRIDQMATVIRLDRQPIDAGAFRPEIERIDQPLPTVKDDLGAATEVGVAWAIDPPGDNDVLATVRTVGRASVDQHLLPDLGVIGHDVRSSFGAEHI